MALILCVRCGDVLGPPERCLRMLRPVVDGRAYTWIPIPPDGIVTVLTVGERVDIQNGLAHAGCVPEAVTA